jgi:AraC-like DNA-binding protein
MNIPDANLLVGKYNVTKDPIVMEILGQDVIDRLFRGEAVSFPDFPAPIQDVVDRGVIKEKPFEAATMDLFWLPIWDGDVFTCVIMFFTVKNMYKGRADISKAQEYIKEHWQDEFDMDKTARAAALSKRHFQRIFKEVTGVTPNEYYQNIKIEKIQEKLFDGDLSVEQAFAACGVGTHGAYFRLFKEKLGMTPAEYRKKNNIQ